MEINNELIRSLGMALAHSLWEGLIILVLVLFALSLAGRSNARLRYVLLVTGHFLLLVAFIATWYITYHHTMATAIKPLARVYSQVNGFVSTSSIFVRTADFTSTLKQFLEPLYPSLAVGWTMGFIFMVIRMVGGFYLSYNMMRKEIFLPDPTLLALFEKAKTKLLMPVTLSLRMSSRQISPMVIGILKPCVIVPVSILSGLNTEQVEAILVHELAHIRRYDHVVMILQTLIVQILFFHPVSWYLSEEINRERENCCDDLVIKTFPNPINYIKALTMIQELNVDGYVPANALLGRSKRLLGRIKRLLKTERRHVPLLRLATIFLLLITLGIAAITIASAGNSGTKKSLGTFFTIKKEKIQAVSDTTKVKKQEKVIAKEEIKDDLKKQKQLEEASRKLEKAHQELEKARLEMEKAREEFARAGGRLRSHYMAELSGESQHLRMNDQMREFKLQHEREFNEQRRAMELQRRAMQDHMRQSQEAMHERMRQTRPENWQRKHPHPMMIVPPVEPISPDVPSPDINLPEIPDVENISPPEPVVPMELLNEDQGEDDKENAEPLDLKLKEIEEE